ncbi:MAG: RsmB/NOP family class I SAM-dependent RNA methyltransferase [Candidatus Omnitrophica bacterium]|nr:RsmB/NOP family class I SAM-dependent RNA methyltransferase [Candidatus Omnitrophota bacterium]
MDKLLYRLPAQFLERIKRIYPKEYPAVLSSFLTDKNTTFRANLIKIDIKTLTQRLKSANIQFRRVDWYNSAFILVKPSQREFQATDFYKQSFIYLQNLSSMVAVMLLEPKEGERILDLCSAPGGKTTQIVSETRGEAQVVAVEKIKVRFYKLLANLKNQGQERLVKTYLADGTIFFRNHADYFDKVLVDAPCSSEANFLVHNPKSYSYWSPRKIKEAQHKQKRLLFSGIMSLKPGGRLVYSTCTFSPEENEQVINWALNKFKDKVYLEKISLPFANLRQGLLEWNTRSFSKEMVFTKRIIPTPIFEGFFVASLRKK